MGVPKFYRWLSERYPQINQLISSSSMLPEIDNFYLDMNGIIHACSHPNDQDASVAITVREMMLSIFRYIDRIVSEIVKPKKVLFMTIDGVAPRAKMNQQRARRFRAAAERTENLENARRKGEVIGDEAMFDSNCITPGTEFMESVSKHLRWFIRKKMKEDPIWRNLEIIYSGHDVPGEGEHKIMQYIREERIKPGYSPNVRHCMYGGDADLIMLGLATHEPHFTLLREVVDFGANTRGRGARQTIIRQTKEASFQLMHLTILREYIEIDFGLNCGWAVDCERMFDDFILLTFLVGNDFLPHLPTLDIGEHAFDVIFTAYRNLLVERPGGYLTLNGEICDFDRLEALFQIIGHQEVEILSKRDDSEKKFNSSRRKRKDKNIMSAEEEDDIEDAKQREYELAVQEALGKSSVNTATVDLPTQLETCKDYRGRYYFEKFKIVPSNGDAKSTMLLADLMERYLEGLMWCLAYYVKGCISWTWYFPYHYGPMLQDMKGLTKMAQCISFTIGAPFRPFQQLLGCLPPASKSMLPRSYQWLMISDNSPLIEFYPLEFKIDQNGKKNSWEAVILLSFIDEKKLLAAEVEHCNESSLSADEKSRNSFGKILTFVYDPTECNTYFSCNPEIGLPDITNCQSRVTSALSSILPGHYFKPALVPGTHSHLPGFPSLALLDMQGVDTDFIKLNTFGSDSKYQSLVLELATKEYDVSKLKVHQLLNRIVFVNYPQLHEAKVVALTTESEEIRSVEDKEGKVSVKTTPHDYITAQKWKKDSVDMETTYMKGRGIPGSGGLCIGDVRIRLRVVPLQGMRRDHVSGSNKKVYGTNEADVPIQLALWNPPSIDTRYQETDELPVHQLLPYGCEVVATAGQLIGCKGVVMGPHTLETVSDNKVNEKKLVSKRRVVDVEFTVAPPEPPFGYAIASSMKEEYFSSKDVCKALQILPTVLGKIVGSIFVDDSSRNDLGLNLKRNGVYQLLGYIRRVEDHGTTNGSSSSSSSSTGNVWGGSIDSVQVVGTVDSVNYDGAAETASWEYSAKTVALLIDYKTKFPVLFHQLHGLPHAKKYTPKELFVTEGDKRIEEVMKWMKAQPFYGIHRTPLTTFALSKEAIAAVERASDVRVGQVTSIGVAKILVKSVPVESVYRGDVSQATDAPLTYNSKKKPKLGDRVVNLNSICVPFGHKGTVVAIHSTQGYVEVVFDEEFVGGRSLEGACSQFRGKLCPWSGLIKTSDEPTESQAARPKQVGATATATATATGTNAATAKAQSNGNVKKGDRSSKDVDPQTSATAILKTILLKKDDKSDSSSATAGAAVVNRDLSSLLKSKLSVVGNSTQDEVKQQQQQQQPSITVKHVKSSKFEDDGMEDNTEKFVVDPQARSDGSGSAALLQAAGVATSSDELPPPPMMVDSFMDMSNVISFPMIPPINFFAAASNSSQPLYHRAPPSMFANKYVAPVASAAKNSNEPKAKRASVPVTAASTTAAPTVAAVEAVVSTDGSDGKDKQATNALMSLLKKDKDMPMPSTTSTTADTAVVVEVSTTTTIVATNDTSNISSISTSTMIKPSAVLKKKKKLVVASTA